MEGEARVLTHAVCRRSAEGGDATWALARPLGACRPPPVCRLLGAPALDRSSSSLQLPSGPPCPRSPSAR